MFSTRAKQDTTGSCPSLVLAAEGHADRAVGDHGGGGAVTHHLGEPRVELDFEVEVGVNVPKSRHQPTAAGIDDLGGPGGVQVGADFGNLAVLNRRLAEPERRRDHRPTRF